MTTENVWNNITLTNEVQYNKRRKLFKVYGTRENKEYLLGTITSKGNACSFALAMTQVYDKIMIR